MRRATQVVNEANTGHSACRLSQDGHPGTTNAPNLKVLCGRPVPERFGVATQGSLQAARLCPVTCRSKRRSGRGRLLEDRRQQTWQQHGSCATATSRPSRAGRGCRISSSWCVLCQCLAPDSKRLGLPASVPVVQSCNVRCQCQDGGSGFGSVISCLQMNECCEEFDGLRLRWVHRLLCDQCDLPLIALKAAQFAQIRANQNIFSHSSRLPRLDGCQSKPRQLLRSTESGMMDAALALCPCVPGLWTFVFSWQLPPVPGQS